MMISVRGKGMNMTCPRPSRGGEDGDGTHSIEAEAAGKARPPEVEVTIVIFSTESNSKKKCPSGA